MTQDQGAAQGRATPGSAPMTGIYDEQVPLVHAGTLSTAAHLFGSVVGAIGAAIFGAGISPILADETVPNDALIGAAQACVKDLTGCSKYVMLPTKHGALTWTAIAVGLGLVLGQFILMWAARPRRK